MPLIEYKMKKDGVLSVENETEDYYCFYDVTAMAEYLFSAIEKTIQEDFVEEHDFSIAYSETEIEIQEVADMPDKRIDLFVKICTDNKGNISKSERTRIFDALSDDEIDQIEQVLKDMFLSEKSIWRRNY